MYYNNDTIIYLNGEFVKAVDARGDLFGQSLITAMEYLKVFVRIKQQVAKQKYLKKKNILTV